MSPYDDERDSFGGRREAGLLTGYLFLTLTNSNYCVKILIFVKFI